MSKNPRVRTFMDSENVKNPKDRLNLHGSFLSGFLITLKKDSLQIFSFSSIWNLETLC